MTTERVEFTDKISWDHPVFKPEDKRYWLYVGLGCPFSHRAFVTRVLKGLEKTIGLSVTHWEKGSNGWKFVTIDDKDKKNSKFDLFYTEVGGINHHNNEITIDSFEDAKRGDGRLYLDGTFDPHNDFQDLKDLYLQSDPNFKGAISIPVLYDTKTKKIVNNQSGDILEIFNSGVFDKWSTKKDTVDLLPSKFKSQIDELHSWTYSGINGGVYKAGFSKTQKEYETNLKILFDNLNKIENILQDRYQILEKTNKDKKDILKNFFLITDTLTESDVTLYSCLIRFDPVYILFLKTNLGTIRGNFPFINLWLKNLYWNIEGFKETTNFYHIKTFYFSMNQDQDFIVPLGLQPSVEKF